MSCMVSVLFEVSNFWRFLTFALIPSSAEGMVGQSPCTNGKHINLPAYFPCQLAHNLKGIYCQIYQVTCPGEDGEARMKVLLAKAYIIDHVFKHSVDYS